MRWRLGGDCGALSTACRGPSHCDNTDFAGVSTDCTTCRQGRGWRAESCLCQPFSLLVDRGGGLGIRINPSLILRHTVYLSFNPFIANAGL